MILYNWEKVFRKASGSSSAILSIIDYITYPKTPKDTRDMSYWLSMTDWSGDCFLLNPDKVLKSRQLYSDQKLAEYVGLASFRSYATYKATKDATLPMEMCPISEKTINDNRLLTLANNKIYFCWEEVTQ